MAAVIAAGLGSRSEALALPAGVAKYAGDALWGLMVFLGVGLMWPSRRTTTAVGLATAACLAIECSQLDHAPWLDAARRTWVGRLTLGDTFGWGDIAAYLVGIGTGGAVERWVRLIGCDTLAEQPPQELLADTATWQARRADGL